MEIVCLHSIDQIYVNSCISIPCDVLLILSSVSYFQCRRVVVLVGVGSYVLDSCTYPWTRH